MARIVVIGGSGHIGGYLVPALVEQGHQVASVSRGLSAGYRPHPAWASVQQVVMDRAAAERSGTFAAAVAGLRPDVVIDLISFDLPSTQALVEALRGRIAHFLHCGTIWVYGRNTSVPADEDDPPAPFGEYGINKAAIEAWLLEESTRSGLPATVFRPGHIVGPGWLPIGPHGNLDASVFARIARGEEIALPNFGLETLHHVHAEDVAQLVLRAIGDRPAALGHTFNVVAERALTLRGYAEAMYRWFGHEPRLRFEPFDAWSAGLAAEHAQQAWEHITRSSCVSMEKARRRLGYQPRYTSLDAIKQALAALIRSGELDAPAGWTPRSTLNGSNAPA